MRPAGIAAILGAVAVQVGLIVGSGAIDADGTAERLLEASKGDADGQLLAGVVISGVGFLLLAIPLTFFFRAAMARSERMMRGLLPLGAIGAVLIAAGLVLNNSSFLDAADDFAASEAQREAQPAPSQGQGDQGGSQQNQPGGGGGGAAEEEARPDQGGTTTVQPTTTTETDTAGAASEDEEDEEDADDRADDALADASGASASAILVRGGALAFAVGFLYAGLWAMRAGLLTRFWGSLGMASAVVLALFFLYFFTLIWFLAMGLFLVGVWFGKRPPAWEAGVAMPWPKPGEQPPDEGDGPIEGQGRELGGPGENGDGEPGPGGGPPPGGPDPDQGPGGGGEPPRKRKRRR